jgi:PKD repeat protein
MKTIRTLWVMAIGLIAFNLNAQITVFPYVQDFEAFAQCGGSCTSTCALQDGWVNAATATRDFSSDTGGTSSSQTGPQVDHTLGTSAGRYLYAESSSPCYTGANSWHLVSPTIDLTGTNDVQFTFWYHMLGQSMGVAHIDVSNDGGVTWVLDVVPSWTDNVDLWQEKVVSLGTWTGSTVNVRIRYENPTNFYGDFSVDDVRIYDLLQDDAGVSAFINPEIPTCSFNDSVSVTLTNFGTDTLYSAGIEWEWNSVGQTSSAWTGALAQGESETVYLGSVSYMAGDDLKAWSTLPNGVLEISSGAGNDTTEILNIQAGLSGTYTIGGNTPDYNDFTSAVADLNTFGVCGPVVFDVRSGVYTEQILLEEVINMDATNTVTFRSEVGHRDSVVLTYASFLSTDNYTVRFDGGDYFNFEQMTVEATGITYGRVLDFLNESNYNTVSDCRVVSNIVTTTSTNAVVIYSTTGSNDNFNSFVGNTIEGGSYGMYWYGASTSSLEEGTQFINNELLNNYYYGARFYYQSNMEASYNSMTTNTTYTGSVWSLYFFYCDNGLTVTHNEIYRPNVYGYGLYFGNCDGAAGNGGVIANNMVSIGNPMTTSTSYGIYVTNSSRADFYNNSVLISSNGNSSRAMYLTSGGLLSLANNILMTDGPGYAFYNASSYNVVDSDHNNFYTTGGMQLNFWSSMDTPTLSDYQLASGLDSNSLNVNPNFYSDVDLHVCSDSLNGMGLSVLSIIDDVDGQPRSTNPDIGADEFSPINSEFLGADDILCTGDSIVLWVGSPSDTILWSTGDTTQMLTITSPGNYYVSINGACGMGSDTINVDPSNLVYTDFLVADTISFCDGDSTQLSSSMVADSYTWSTLATIPSIYVQTSGTYILDIVDACGTGTDSVTIDVLTPPVAGFTHTGSYASADFTNTSTGSAGSYLWDFGDSHTSTEENPEHIFATAGPHTVSLTVTNDCGSDTYTTTISMVGIDELSSTGEFTVHPNPSEGLLVVDLNTLKQANLDIAVENMLGELVYFKTVGTVDGSHSHTIDLRNESTGMYFVHVHIDGVRSTKKVVIK